MKMLTNEVWKEDFPNKKWLEDRGFKLLKDCEDVVDWAANQAEREYLDNTYRKELSKGVYIHVFEDRNECWNAVLFSDTYNYSLFDVNAKNAVNEILEKFTKDLIEFNKVQKALKKMLTVKK